MMIIIHALEDCAADNLLLDMKIFRASGGIIALVGMPGTFDEVALPDNGGRVGGSILRVTHLQPQASAFGVLVDCARLFQRLLAEHLDNLHYAQLGSGPVSRVEQGSESAPVTWTSATDGVVTAFRLAPLVASSPLLMSLTTNLAARPMPDERRFTFLAAAFKGT